MRKLTLFFAAIMALALTSCGKKAPVMYDKEGFKQIITFFEDSPVKDKEFKLIFFQSEEALKGNTLDFGRFILIMRTSMSLVSSSLAMVRLGSMK